MSGQTVDIPLALQAHVYASGLNGALHRLPKIAARRLPLLENFSLGLPWKPTRTHIKTTGITFPEGLEFTAESSEQRAGSREPETESSGLSAAGSPLSALRSRRSSFTRLKPPADALSLKDRLFYLLQPPLESWLAGQELIMPFEPFGYQYEGIAWLFSQTSALLADEMGLGKTMQAITAIRLLLRCGQIRRVLLICPKPLITNWQREFRMWAEELPVITVEGDSARRNLLWSMESAPVVIANYELLIRDLAPQSGELRAAGREPEAPNVRLSSSSPLSALRSPLSFDVVVLDEAQRIKNRDSLTAQIARSIGRRRSWALTGTPIENRPEEMASLFEFLEVVPPRATPDLRQLHRLSQEYVLRRTKDRVMTDLPPRLDRDEYLELTPAQQQAYRIAEKEGVIHLNEMGESISIQHVFELILRLKQIANFDPLTGESAKLDRVTADMEEIASSGGKAILFSQWTQCLEWLAVRLSRFGPLVYHGGVPSKKREQVLHRFQNDPSCHVLLMSYGTGAVGLNLQFAGYVFLFDRWWNPAVEDQAINRAHRIGQQNPVIVTKFISQDTIEERIDRVLQQKRQMFEMVLGDGSPSNASLSLTAAEIFGLFELKAPAHKGMKSLSPAGPTDREHNAPA